MASALRGLSRSGGPENRLPAQERDGTELTQTEGSLHRRPWSYRGDGCECALLPRPLSTGLRRIPALHGTCVTLTVPLDKPMGQLSTEPPGWRPDTGWVPLSFHLLRVPEGMNWFLSAGWPSKQYLPPLPRHVRGCPKQGWRTGEAKHSHTTGSLP